MSLKELISLWSLISGKMLKMAICVNFNPRIFFPLPTKDRALWGSRDSRESLRSRLFNKLISNFMLQEASYCTLITWKGKNKVWTNHKWRNSWYQIVRRKITNFALRYFKNVETMKCNRTGKKCKSNSN